MLYNRPVKSKDNQSWFFSHQVGELLRNSPENRSQTALEVHWNCSAIKQQSENRIPNSTDFQLTFASSVGKRGGIHTHPSSTHPHSCLRKFFRLVLPSPLSGSSFSFRPLCGLTLWHLLHQPIIIAMASMHSPIDLINLREKRMFVPHFSADHPRNLLFPNSDD